MGKKILTFFITLFVIISIAITIFAIKYQGAIEYIVNNNDSVSKKIYYAKDFGFEDIKSSIDYDNDGIDDYTDILNGAKIEAENKPEYKDAYYQGGYPPETEGVCSDVIWRALKNAGYSLKEMVDQDIKNNLDAYPRVNGKPDPNIVFRRVKNMIVFFERNHISLTIDLNKIEDWQPGDIVVFQSGGKDHIGIISDKRNEKGIPYLIHNGGQENREEDGLEFYNEYVWPITKHFRLKDIGEGSKND